MKIADLTVYQSPFPKIRLWKDGDGGYIICDNLIYDCFLSWGIGDDISFEEDFLEKYPHIQCHAFDWSIEAPPSWFIRYINRHELFILILWRYIPKVFSAYIRKIDKLASKFFYRFHPYTKKGFIFYKKYIGSQESDKYTHLHSFFKTHKDIMIKMDIEWGEFEWFDSLNSEQLCRIQQLVIEFHTPFNEWKWNTLSRLAQTHWLVHFHPNNCTSEMFSVEGVAVPHIFECTYIRKSIWEAHLSYSSDYVPGLLDQKNVYENPDTILTGYPYNTWV